MHGVHSRAPILRNSQTTAARNNSPRATLRGDRKTSKDSGNNLRAKGKKRDHPIVVRATEDHEGRSHSGEKCGSEGSRLEHGLLISEASGHKDQ